MAKQSGLGDNLYVRGFDVSGDIGSLGRIGGGLASTQDVAAINMSAMARIGLLKDGAIEFTSFWNPGPATDAAHQVLRTLPTTDVPVTYCRGTALGSHAASLLGKQVNYDGTRGSDGSLTYATSAQAAGFGLEWGQLLTPGKLTQAAAGNGATVDLGAVPVSYSFGWAAYMHLFAFTGTSITVKIQDSADGVTFADLAGATFATFSSTASQRISSGQDTTNTVRRYVRAVSSGTFTNAVFAVNFVRYESGGHA